MNHFDRSIQADIGLDFKPQTVFGQSGIDVVERFVVVCEKPAELFRDLLRR